MQGKSKQLVVINTSEFDSIMDSDFTGQITVY